jgi:murein DD-endopeptidase MepM/ murein hydrolase activator NlpD
MVTEFRQISERCPIIDLQTKTVILDGLPDQLVEILPHPALTVNQTEEEWKPWYFVRVYGDDGIRFTEGLIPKNLEGPTPTNLTKPLQQTIDEEAFAKACVDAAAAAGVDAADLLAVAKYLSAIKNVPAKESSAAGPFLFNEKVWDNLVAEIPDLGLAPSHRLWPDRQPAAAAAEAADIAQKLQDAGSEQGPTAAELVFVRFFGRSSVRVLIDRRKAAGEDPFIEDVITNFCSQELAGCVSKDLLASEIAASHPELLTSANVPRKVSGVLQALIAALQPLLTQAKKVVQPLQPEAPGPESHEPPVVGNLSLGVNKIYQNEILAAATKCDMDPAGLSSLIDAEAAKLADGIWNRDSRNPKSTAVGLTQFLKGTWIQMATLSQTTLNKAAKERGFVDGNDRVTNLAALLDLRTDPALSIISAAEYAASNLKFVVRKNPPYRGFYDPGTPDGKMRLAYLCHHEGAGGALAYLRGGKSQSYIDALDAYIDRKIVPSHFRSTTAKVVGPGPDLKSERDVAGPSTTLTPGNGTIPNNVMPVPAAKPVAFAALQAAEAQWHWPVITRDTQAMKVSYRTAPNNVAGRPSREFLANRQDGRRYHVGMDIFCHQGDVVLAIADGTVVAFYPFYQGTNALFVAHAGVVVNYGEVSPNSESEFGWRVNGPVTAGQKIARVGRLNMIHFETYHPETKKNERWMQDGSSAPTNLLNPTKVLLGLAARGTRML